jgi:hypothetical protein
MYYAWRDDSSCNILAGKLVKERPLRIHGYRWKDNISMDLKATENEE